MRQPHRPGCLALLALAALWACGHSPTEPGHDATLTVAPYGTAAVVTNGYSFDAGAAAVAVRKGYARIRADASDPARVDGLSLDYLRIEVVADAGRAPSMWYTPNLATIEPGREALLEGQVAHYLCDRLRYSEPGCLW